MMDLIIANLSYFLRISYFILIGFTFERHSVSKMVTFATNFTTFTNLEQITNSENAIVNVTLILTETY